MRGHILKTLAAASLLALAGCSSSTPSTSGGGGGGEGPSAGEGQASGVIELPAGYVAPESFTVTTPGGEASSSNLGWVVDLPGGEPALAVVTNPEGEVVFAGFVAPGSGNVLGPRSSAVVAMFYGAHLFELPRETWEGAIAELASHAALDALSQTFAEAMAVDPAVLMTEDAALLAAVEAALGTIAADGGAATTQSALNAGNANITVTPAVAQSGVLVGPNLTGTGMQIHNASRRLGWYYVYETGYRDAAGQDLGTDPPELLADGFISSAAGINSGGGTIGTVAGALTNSLDFSPLTLPPIGLTVGEDQQRVYAEVIVAGAYLPDGGGVPSWADGSDPRHEDWIAQAQLMTTASFVRDVVIPAIFSVALPIKGGGDGLIEPLTLESIAVSLASAAPNLTGQIYAGEWGAALKTVMVTLAGNSNLRTHIALELADAVGKFAEGQTQNAMGLLTKANFYTAVVDIGLAGLDIAQVVSDVEAASALDRWEITAIKAKVLVSAERDTLDPARADTRLTATVPGAQPDEYHCFLWTVTEGPGNVSGLLDEPDTGSPRTAVSDDGEAIFDVAPGDIVEDGPLATVTVAVYSREQGEACTFPPSGELIGEGLIGLLGDDDPYLDPCVDGDQTFDFGYWNKILTAPQYSLSGSIGGTVKVTVTVPGVDVENEPDHRDVDVVIPRPVGVSKEDIKVSGGDLKSWQVEDSTGLVLQVRADDDGDAPVKYIQLSPGAAHVRLRAAGSLSVSVPTLGYPGGCEVSGTCCPYVGTIEAQNRLALMGPIMMVRVHAIPGEGVKDWIVIDNVDVQ